MGGLFHHLEVWVHAWNASVLMPIRYLRHVRQESSSSSGSMASDEELMIFGFCFFCWVRGCCGGFVTISVFHFKKSNTGRSGG